MCNDCGRVLVTCSELRMSTSNYMTLASVNGEALVAIPVALLCQVHWICHRNWRACVSACVGVVSSPSS